MFREIRTSEKIYENKKEEKRYGYMDIKPEKELSVNELFTMVNSIFREEAEKAMAN